MPRLAAFNFGARKFGFGSLFSSAAATEATYIEDVFSTYLYTGNGSTQTITNGIDLSGQGGLVWIKGRTANSFGTNHVLFDSAQGPTFRLFSNLTSAQGSNGAASFSSTGFNLPSGDLTYSTESYVSWTFRKQPKFFDIVTYTGNGATSRDISHNLGSVPGCIIVKSTSAAYNWYVYHRSTGNTQALILNLTAASAGTGAWKNTTPTSTVFTVDNTSEVNENGQTYVAYLFAHNAGGFGLSGTDNVISCGSFTSTGQQITLGYEPQFLLVKKASGVSDWYIFDNMRGLSGRAWRNFTGAGDETVWLKPNSSAAESYDSNYGWPTATGFYEQNFGGGTWIYIAIRRGPMKVPTSGTSVFSPIARTPAGATYTASVGFPVDLVIQQQRTVANTVNQANVFDRLRGATKQLATAQTQAEATQSGITNFDSNDGFTAAYGSWSALNWISGYSEVYWNFRRAPSYFDVVCFRTQSSGATTVTHGLGVAPEFMIVKSRDTASAWYVYSAAIGNVGAGFLNSSGNFQYANGYWDYLSSPAPTATQFTCGTSHPANSNTVAYLFATCAGVSKVGSYTGTGTTQQINCGFTGGARFVLIKRTDSTGDWYTWDTARGIIAGNDPYLLLDSTAAEVTNTDYIDPVASGFELSSTAPAAINANGGTYIFLAIA